MERMEDGMWCAVYLGHRTHATQSVEFAWSSKVVVLCVFVFFFPSLFLKLVQKPNRVWSREEKKNIFLSKDVGATATWWLNDPGGRLDVGSDVGLNDVVGHGLWTHTPSWRSSLHVRL